MVVAVLPLSCRSAQPRPVNLPVQEDDQDESASWIDDLCRKLSFAKVFSCLAQKVGDPNAMLPRYTPSELWLVL
jgi:superfamily I DNA and RNA helicase